MGSALVRPGLEICFISNNSKLLFFSIKFPSQNLELFDTESCCDQVEISPGAFEFAGQPDVDIKIKASEFFVHFSSDGSEQGEGFRLRWECTTAEDSRKFVMAAGIVGAVLVVGCYIYHKCKQRAAATPSARPGQADVTTPPAPVPANNSERSSDPLATPSVPPFRQNSLPSYSNYAWSNVDVPMAGTVPDIDPPSYDEAIKSHY